MIQRHASHSDATLYATPKPPNRPKHTPKSRSVIFALVSVGNNASGITRQIVSGAFQRVWASERVVEERKDRAEVAKQEDDLGA